MAALFLPFEFLLLAYHHNDLSNMYEEKRIEYEEQQFQQKIQIQKEVKYLSLLNGEKTIQKDTIVITNPLTVGLKYINNLRGTDDQNQGIWIGNRGLGYLGGVNLQFISLNHWAVKIDGIIYSLTTDSGSADGKIQIQIEEDNYDGWDYFGENNNDINTICLLIDYINFQKQRYNLLRFNCKHVAWIIAKFCNKKYNQEDDFLFFNDVDYSEDNFILVPLDKQYNNYSNYVIKMNEKNRQESKPKYGPLLPFLGTEQKEILTEQQYYKSINNKLLEKQLLSFNQFLKLLQLHIDQDIKKINTIQNFEIIIIDNGNLEQEQEQTLEIEQSDMFTFTKKIQPIGQFDRQIQTIGNFKRPPQDNYNTMDMQQSQPYKQIKTSYTNQMY